MSITALDDEVLPRRHDGCKKHLTTMFEYGIIAGYHDLHRACGDGESDSYHAAGAERGWGVGSWRVGAGLDTRGSEFVKVPYHIVDRGR